MTERVKDEYPKALYQGDGKTITAADAAHHETLKADGWLTADEIDAQPKADSAESAADAPPADDKPKRGRRPKADSAE